MEDDSTVMNLPPGFRFHPTDEEIITYYLKEKVLDSRFSASAIGQVDLNKNEPWDLPKKAKMGKKEFYFFCQRDRKYPTGMRTNRATESGYWKATGKDKEIYKGKGCLVGMKKTLVFYTGRAPKGEKSNWVMHEYRLQGKFSYHRTPKNEEWVVCRVFHKASSSGMTNKMNSFNHKDDDLLGCSSPFPSLVDMDMAYSNRQGSSLSDSVSYSQIPIKNPIFNYQTQPISMQCNLEFSSNPSQDVGIGGADINTGISSFELHHQDIRSNKLTYEAQDDDHISDFGYFLDYYIPQM